MDNKQVTIFPLDKEIRYSAVCEIITQLCRKDISILDVGGEEGALDKFLPDAHFHILDPLVKEDTETQTKGKAKNMPFTNDQFGVVCSADTLEHIPVEDREQSILEMLRVTKDYVIIAFPFRSAENELAEKLINNYYKKFAGTDHPWLKEHIDNGLPSLNQLSKFLDQNKIHHKVLYNQNTQNWQTLMQTYINAIYTPNFSKSYSDILTKYYQDIYPKEDNTAENSYRAVLVISKGGKLPKDLGVQESKSAPVELELLSLIAETEREIRNSLRTTADKYAGKFHQAGKEHHQTHLKLQETQKELNIITKKYHKLGEENHETTTKLKFIRKHYIEATKQRNDFERQLQAIFRSPKWKIANLITLPFMPFKYVYKKFAPYINELFHSLKDIDGYRKLMGLKFGISKFQQLISLYLNYLPFKYLTEKGDNLGVLFLSDEQRGCYRFRVLHQKEQLEKQKFFVKDISVNFPRLNSLIKVFDVFIFVRPHDTAKNLALAKEIKKQGKTVVFENDDLIFDPESIKKHNGSSNLSPKFMELYAKGIGTQFIKLADYGLTTTKMIKDKMEEQGLITHVNRNCLSDELIQISKETKSIKSNDYINIGYVSGTKTHDNDFAVVSPVLIKLMTKYPNVRLLIMGHLHLEKEFKKFHDRIIKLPFVNWRKVTTNIIQSDINIAPLENTIFNKAKSELKYFEAGILKIPTVASNTRPFQFAIKDGLNGFLASSQKDWEEKLIKLIEDKKLCKDMGEKAYRDVKKRYATKSSSKELAEFIREITKTKQT